MALLQEVANKLVTITLDHYVLKLGIEKRVCCTDWIVGLKYSKKQSQCVE